ncbi:SixA phosphatase family protein [Haloflavibacter putidus]|uniref:Histidine phosphatase family protein n=1 Tax=Haloflavibacter putidus TaxID=2576776 RepID=A0A507ZTZ5_9FLAO|nr:histidine phosphatase family protein [Haloflavibacter putidus]TQD40061.1 histidine phosphatase family protein [Haloflavibacter putidus]
MKKLIIVRHGKSSWKEDLPDNKRPLKKRGFNDAELIIKAFKLYLQKPIKAYSSHAVRALTTAELFKEGLDIKDENFTVIKDLYTFDASNLIGFIKNLDDNLDKVMLFGHNPAITETVNQLGSKSFDNVPTTGLVVIDFDTDSWSKINDGRTLLSLFPRNFK